MKISVLIPAYRADTIAAPINSVIKQTWIDWELIAVGQGPPDGERSQSVKKTVEALRSEDNRVNYVHVEKMGATVATNVGISKASGEIIAIIDDDCEAREDWLETIYLFFKENPAIGFLGGAAVAPAGLKKRLGVCPTSYPSEVVYDPVAMDGQPPPGWDWISSNMAMRREIADLVGPFDENLGPGAPFPAADDTDYRIRLEAKGVKMATSPRVVVNHTYGYRYGLRAVMDHQYNYAYGNGALAAKMTLMNDSRGEEWLHTTKDRVYQKLRMLHQPQHFIRSLLRWLIFKKAYDRCLRDYRVVDDVLVPLARG